MAGDTVTTIFGGDDSTFQAAARKVKDSVMGLAGLAPGMQFFKEAARGAESLHAATDGAKAGIEGLKAAFAPLIAMGAALVGVSSVFAAIKHSIELAAKVETAEFHLGAVDGGADKAAASIKKLHDIGDETAQGFSKLADGSIKLQEAGQSADEAAESMGRLSKIALNSGNDIDELGAIYARVLTKSDVSSKDLVKLAMTGIPGMSEIAQKFKEAERNTAAWDVQISQTIQNLDRMYEQTEKQTSSVNSFGSKIGLMQASFTAWAQSGGSAIGGLVQAIGGVGESGIGRMSGTFGKEFTEGLKQIETETGLSGRALQAFMAAGKVGYEDLISAAGRFREEQHKAADRDLEAQKLANQNALLVKQRGLLDEVRNAIETATKPGGIFGNIDAFLQTFNGKWEKMQHSISGMFKNFGTPLIDALKPGLDSLTDFFHGPGKAAAVEWGGKLGGVIKDAMTGLEHGDWGPLQQDGEAAFAAILKLASDGMANLGIVLAASIAGPGIDKVIVGLSKMLVACAEAFGEAMMQAAASPLRQVERFDIAVMPGVRNIVAARNKADFDKFTPEQKKEFADQGGGAKPTALEEVTAGNIATDSDVIAKIKGFSGVMAHIKEGSEALSTAFSGAVDIIKRTVDTVTANSDRSNADPELVGFHGPLATVAKSGTVSNTDTAGDAPDSPIASSSPELGPGGMYFVLKPLRKAQAAADSVPVSPVSSSAIESQGGVNSAPAVPSQQGNGTKSGGGGDGGLSAVLGKIDQLISGLADLKAVFA
jgi:hypothetical protein